MADIDDLSNPGLPEIPAQNNSPENSNEPISAAGAPVQDSLFKKIRGAGSAILDAAGVGRKRGRGRPKNCQSCGQPETRCTCDGGPAIATPNSQGDNSEEKPLEVIQAAGGGGSGAAPRPAGDPLITRSIVSALKGALSFAKGKIRSKAKQARLEKTFVEDALAECERDQAEELAAFTENVELVCAKYNVKTEYAPEVALAVSVAKLGVGYWTLLQTLNAEIERRKAAEKNPGK